MNLADRLTGHVANELRLKPTNQLRTANAWRCAAGTHVQNDLVTSFNDLQAERSKSLVASPAAPRHPTLNGGEGQAQGSDSFDNLGLPRGSAPCQLLRVRACLRSGCVGQSLNRLVIHITPSSWRLLRTRTI